MIPTKEFYAALAIAVCHATTTAERAAELPNLQNVFLSFEQPDILRLVGTDGYRLASIELVVVHGQPVSTVALGLADAEDLCDACEVPASDSLTITPFDSDVMFISSTGGMVSYSIQPAEPPNWQSILAKMPPPGGQVDGLRIDVDFMLEALRVCKPLQRAKKPTVKLRTADLTPLFMLPELRDDLAAVRSVTIAIMYKGSV
jgi:hypothetical protein